MLNGLDLFSGIGGLSIALGDWVRPIAYCEIDTYCQAVLLNQMDRSTIATAPIWDDIRTLGRESGGFPDDAIDIIYGGFPCQDISVAGRGRGLEGERSGLFFEIMRLAEEIKPKLIFLENVPAITSRGGIRVVREIAEMGYDCRWCVISAASIGALHKRERWFLLSNAKHARSHGIEERGGVKEAIHDNKEGKNEAVKSERIHSSPMLASKPVPNSQRKKCSRLSIRETPRQPPIGISDQYATVHEWQEAVSSIRRVTDGVSYRVDRIRSLGNAVVPSQAKEAFKILMGYK